MASLLQFPTAQDNYQQNNGLDSTHDDHKSNLLPKKLILNKSYHHSENESKLISKPALKMNLVQGMDDLLDLPKPLIEKFLDSRYDIDLKEELFLRSKPQHSLLNYSRALYLYRIEHI